MAPKALFGRDKKDVQSQKPSIVPEGFIGGVFYTRVSTTKQEDKGNGIEAQKEAILKFAKDNKIFQIGEFMDETISGGNKLQDRPILKEAIKIAKDHKAYVVTSKLDRLSRNAALVANMLEEGFLFVTVEHGFKADPLVIRIIAAVAQKERELISERTRAGMAQVKKRYDMEYERDLRELGPDKAVKKRLGIPSEAINREGSKHISHVRRREALEDAQKCWGEYINPVIHELEEEMDKRPTRAEVAERMNAKGFKNKNGREWTTSILYHMISKLKRVPGFKEFEDRKYESDTDSDTESGAERSEGAEGDRKGEAKGDGIDRSG